MDSLAWFLSVLPMSAVSRSTLIRYVFVVFLSHVLKPFCEMQTLRTNLRTKKRPPPGTYTEATYASASSILNGQPLTKAQEMGGFCLGSTIVLVFEAPKEFEFALRQGQRVKVGEKLGDVKVEKTPEERGKQEVPKEGRTKSKRWFWWT
jgi:hypothetical protein